MSRIQWIHRPDQVLTGRVGRSAQRHQAEQSDGPHGKHGLGLCSAVCCIACKHQLSVGLWRQTGNPDAFIVVSEFRNAASSKQQSPPFHLRVTVIVKCRGDLRTISFQHWRALSVCTCGFPDGSLIRSQLSVKYNSALLCSY